MLVYRILELKLVQGVYDFELFWRYVRKPVRFNKTIFDAEYANDCTKNGVSPGAAGKEAFPGGERVPFVYESTLSQHLKLSQYKDFQENALVTEYVKEYFRLEGIKEEEAKNIDPNKNLFGDFDKIIHGSILKKEYFNQQVLLGKSPEGLMDFLTEAKVYEIKESKRLYFLRSNKLQFKHGEDVSVQLELKNISNLVLNIYELNTTNCYLKKLAPIKNEIPVAGLIPSVSRRFKYTQ